jgi:hypothetical protein
MTKRMALTYVLATLQLLCVSMPGSEEDGDDDGNGGDE